jgi:hypothetical protein
MNNDIRNPKGKAELIDTGHPVLKKPYSAPKITFIECLEVVAGICSGGGKSNAGDCGPTGPFTS